jgi:hypothetical protein
MSSPRADEHLPSDSAPRIHASEIIADYLEEFWTPGLELVGGCRRLHSSRLDPHTGWEKGVIRWEQVRKETIFDDRLLADLKDRSLEGEGLPLRRMPWLYRTYLQTAYATMCERHRALY